METPRYTPSHEQDTSSTIDTADTNKLRLTKRGAVVLGAGSLAVGASLGVIGGEVSRNLEYDTTVGSAEAVVTETPIQAVKDGVEQIAEQSGFDPAEVPNQIYTGQELADELPTNDAGTRIQVTVEENGFGKKRVTATPLVENVSPSENGDTLPAPAQREPNDR